MKKKETIEKIDNLPLVNLSIFKSGKSYFEEKNEDYLNFDNRKDSYLEDILKNDEFHQNDKNNKNQFYKNSSIRSMSFCFANNPQLIFNKDTHEESDVLKSDNEDTVQTNDNRRNSNKSNQEEKIEKTNLSIKNDNKSKLKFIISNIKEDKELKNENIENDKKTNLKSLNHYKMTESEKINIKTTKTRNYWEKNNYFLIPNIFKLLSKYDNKKTEFYIEHLDYCRKEILVQTNGQKVSDYVSLVNKEEIKKKKIKKTKE